MDAEPDDVPLAVSFKQLKKDKFVLSRALKQDFEVAKRAEQRSKHFRDPRFDPRVHGLCVLNDWTVLQKDQAKQLKILKRQLKYATSDKQRQRIQKALTLLYQRKATQKDVELRRKLKNELHNTQITEMKAGKRPSFLTRGELRSKIREERMKSLSKREQAKYLAHQAKKSKKQIPD
uniref:rRNA biogenesis protein RRP36 n=1 Tax=Schistocephalus solidus TaxID=70667 RepID=A0A0X3PG85_SCHSO